MCYTSACASRTTTLQAASSASRTCCNGAANRNGKSGGLPLLLRGVLVQHTLNMAVEHYARGTGIAM